MPATTKVEFERVYLRYETDEEEQASIRVKIKQLLDGDWSYEFPGGFRHVCSSRECSDVDRWAMVLLTA